MPYSLYSVSAPVLSHYLKHLHKMLGVADGFANDGDIPASHILTARLAEGMFPFAQQVSTACGFVYRTCCPLLNIDAPPLAGGENSFKQLQERVDATLRFLASIRDQELPKNMPQAISTTAGFSELSFSAEDYVHRYAMPNFFFHLTMAYAILRAQGVPLGKGDFDGYHAYATGFRFHDPSSA